MSFTLLQEITQLTEQEITIVESETVFDEIKNIVRTGIKVGLDKISRDIHTYATQTLHKFSRDSKEFQILNKIVANPKTAASQLMAKTINDDVPTLNSTA